SRPRVRRQSRMTTARRSLNPVLRVVSSQVMRAAVPCAAVYATDVPGAQRSLGACLVHSSDELCTPCAAWEQKGDEAARGKQQVFEAIADALAMHAAIEEKRFYPAVKARRTEDVRREGQGSPRASRASRGFARGRPRGNAR